MLEVYDKAEFYSKDPNKEIDLERSIGFKLMIALSKNTEMRNLIKLVESKKKEMAAKDEQKHPVQPAQTTVSTPKVQPSPPPPQAVQQTTQPATTNVQTRPPEMPRPRLANRRDPPV